jgi:hypothetical protein
MISRLIFAVLLFACPVAAQAVPGSSAPSARWVRVSATDQFIVYVDTATIRGMDTRVRFWQRSDHAAEVRASGGTAYTRSVYLAEVQCSERRWRTVTGTLYHGEAAVYQYPPTYDATWQYPTPESVLEEIVEFICARTGPRG